MLLFGKVSCRYLIDFMCVQWQHDLIGLISMTYDCILRSTLQPKVFGRHWTRLRSQTNFVQHDNRHLTIKIVSPFQLELGIVSKRVQYQFARTQRATLYRDQIGLFQMAEYVLVVVFCHTLHYCAIRAFASDRINGILRSMHHHENVILECPLSSCSSGRKCISRRFGHVGIHVRCVVNMLYAFCKRTW